MRYLVSGSEGPGFASPEEASRSWRRSSFQRSTLMKLEAQKKIAARGPSGWRPRVCVHRGGGIQ
jgi:hypothetical protein